MNNTQKLSSILFMLILASNDVLAGPGGQVAKAALTSIWAKVFFAVLGIIFLPLIIYVMLKEARAKKRALKDLAFVKSKTNDPSFDWIKITQRIKDCHARIHSAWEKSDMEESSKWMTNWYWQNQQVAVLDRWEREGLKNICNVKKINSIKPILFKHNNDNNIEHNGSTLHVSISVNMVDFLVHEDSKKVVEGCKKVKDVDAVWVFELVENKWVVASIEGSEMSLEYAGLMLDLPAVEDSLLTNSNS